MARTSFKTQSSAREGPVSGGYFVVSHFVPASTTLTATTTKKWKAPFACRVVSISNCSTFSAGSATWGVVTTAGNVITTGTAFGATGVLGVLEGAASLGTTTRDLAKGDTLTITIDCTGITTTGTTVDVTLYGNGHVNADRADD